MKTSWQTATGQLACRWTLFPHQPDRDAASTESTDVYSSYLPPPPDFASHSPFGGPTWFLPPSVNRAPKP